MLFRNYLPLKNWGLSFKQSWVPFTKGCIVQSLVECGQVVLEKIFEFLLMYFYYFIIIFILEKDRALHLNKLGSPSTKDAMYQVWLKLVQWFFNIGFFNFGNVFLLFHNYLPLEKAGLFIWINLDSLYPRMLCAKIVWNWSSGSWEDF